MGEKKNQGQLEAVWFAAGTAAVMACLERAMLVSFVEQWRAVVFLALNLLLLAILFTSPSSSPPNSAQESQVQVQVEPPPSISSSSQESQPGGLCVVGLAADEETMKKRKQCCSREEEEEHGEDCGDGSLSKVAVMKSRIRRKERQTLTQTTQKFANYKAHELTKEEFNERVEAFIATFRQHLVSDAKGKSCRFHSSSSSTTTGAGINQRHPHRHGGIAMRF